MDKLKVAITEELGRASLATDAGPDAIGNKRSNKGKVDLTSEEARRRGWSNLKPLQPGQTANPSGRPKMPDEVRKALEGASLPAVRKLAELVNCPDPRVALLASQTVLDRLYGKPTQQVDANVTTTNVQQAHLQVLIELQQKREAAMKTIEARVEENEQDPEQKD